jgi:hypothetical protein
MSQPSMGIPIPKPLEIPMATILDPIVPVRGKPPVWGAGGGAGPSSAGSTGGGGSSGWGQMAGMAAGAAIVSMIPGFGLFSAAGMGIMGGGGAIGGFLEGLF